MASPIKLMNSFSGGVKHLMKRLEQSVLISILDWSPLVNVSADTGLQQIFYWTKQFLKYQTGFCLFLH